ncbi:MAG: serine/threonine protein phosphatase [Clostridia bacterium]|nr:serine/threonine protein phosphatase [Clostridia bacterium]
MYTFSRLNEVYKASHELIIDGSSKIVFFSDCHRGDNSKADNFAPNRSIYLSALEYYYTHGFTYVEIGDGDELWENKHFSSIIQAHLDVYLLMQKFYNKGRLYMVWGNHDIMKKNRNFVRKNLYEYYNPVTQKFDPLLDGISIYEGLILRYKDKPNSIFVVHGHQGDLLNDFLWPVACFLVRYIWRYLESLGFINPVSPARSTSRMYSIENNIVDWVKANNQMLIAGHTHNPAFATPGSPPYFNSGSCVSRGYITCIEVQNGEISLSKWSRKPDRSCPLKISHEVIAGPVKVEDFS